MTETYEKSILHTKWVPPSRPYSQIELSKNRDTFFEKFHISLEYITHEKCGHSYYVKENSKKFRELQECDYETRDIGNCSVCWKLRNTPHPMKKLASHFVNLYTENFFNMEERLSYFDTTVERIFYIWLYRERYDRD